jgi:hypothetical protein
MLQHVNTFRYLEVNTWTANECRDNRALDVGGLVRGSLSSTALLLGTCEKSNKLASRKTKLICVYRSEMRRLNKLWTKCTCFIYSYLWTLYFQDSVWHNTASSVFSRCCVTYYSQICIFRILYGTLQSVLYFQHALWQSIAS